MSGPIRSLIPFVAALALLAAACPGEGTDGASPSPPAAEDGLLEGGDAPDEEEEPGDGLVPGPPISPDPPEPGEPTRVNARDVDSGSQPHGQRSSPMLLLGRTPSEAGRRAGRSPVSEPANILRSWDRYPQRALAAVIASPQPDAGFTVEIEAVSVTRGGTRLLVFARIRDSRGPAAQAISVPWAVVSVDGGATALVERCILSFEGATPIRTACGG